MRMSPWNSWLPSPFVIVTVFTLIQPKGEVYFHSQFPKVQSIVSRLTCRNSIVKEWTEESYSYHGIWEREKEKQGREICHSGSCPQWLTSCQVPSPNRDPVINDQFIFHPDENLDKQSRSKPQFTSLRALLLLSTPPLCWSYLPPTPRNIPLPIQGLEGENQENQDPIETPLDAECCRRFWLS